MTKHKDNIGETDMKQLIDTKPIIEREKETLIEDVAGLKRKPIFTVVSVGENQANERYIRNKNNHCADVGIRTKHVNLPRTITEEQLIVQMIEEQKECDSIILQLPLECDNTIDVDTVLHIIKPRKDVDGLNVYNQGALFMGKPSIAPATPLGCMLFLKEIGYDVAGKNVLVIGRSQLLGKPVAQLLMQANATVTQAHSRSDFKEDMSNGKYDVVISCVGRALEFKNIKTDVIIDCGINFKDGRMVGDVDIDTCDYMFATIPPNKDKGIRGGLGTLTCLCLLQNIIDSYKLQGGI